MKRMSVRVFVGLVAASAALLVCSTSYFEQLNLGAYDFTMRVAGPVPPVTNTVIVAIDDATLDHLGPWPWRQKLAHIVDVIAKDKPRVIGLDILLDDQGDGQGDAALAQAISAAPVVLATRIISADGEERAPQARFQQAGVRVGHVHTDPDLDTVNRQLLPAKKTRDSVVPGFAFEVVRAAGGSIDPVFETSVSGATIFRRQPLNIRFAGEPGTFPRVPAWQIFDGQVASGSFSNRIVLIGWTAEGVNRDVDSWLTPFSAGGLKMPGVEIHANAIDTIYGSRWIGETRNDILFVLLFATFALLWWIDRRFEGVRFYIAAFTLLPAVVALSVLLMKYGNVWLPFPPFIASMALAVPALEVWKITRVNRDLDARIASLSTSTRQPRNLPWDSAERVCQSLAATPQRASWLQAIRDFEDETVRRRQNRQRLLGARWRNSRWRLMAVDYFNEELVQYLSFNTAVLSSIEDVTIVSDVSGRIVYQNPAAQRLEGFSEEAAFAPEYFSSLLDGRDFCAAFAEVVASRKTLQIPFVPARSSRPVFHVSLAPVGRAGVVLSLHDATAQFELNLAKNEMISLVSHELRTPLTAIRGYSDMLLKYGLVQEKGKQFLGTIVEESDRLTRLIQSFLDIAYIESGRQKLAKTEFEIDPVIRDMISVLDPVASAREIRIEAKSAAGLLIHADRLLLSQALNNLLVNAIKYSPGGTTVRVAVSNGNGRIAFTVTDEGFGIPPADVVKIFEKFYRRPNAETQNQTGFGLGLAFVKEVAACHGGEITVDSTVGKGSTFTLQIPL